jgi:putative transposase
MTDWPHAPVHRLGEAGVHIITVGTYLKQHHFADRARLDLLQAKLFELADEHSVQLHAWALMSNHYHLLGESKGDPTAMRKFTSRLHSITATYVNRLDNTPARKVWFGYWDTLLTFEKSYLARLNYVHQNPVKHGLVDVATNYPWCSADWFERASEPAFVQTVLGFRTDRVSVEDDFGVIRKVGESGACTPHSK